LRSPQWPTIVLFFSAALISTTVNACQFMAVEFDGDFVLSLSR
jgi:hypothetical protein